LNQFDGDTGMRGLVSVECFGERLIRLGAGLSNEHELAGEFFFFLGAAGLNQPNEAEGKPGFTAFA
jgi:hypothetical protein